MIPVLNIGMTILDQECLHHNVIHVKIQAPGNEPGITPILAWIIGVFR
jgi:hypothetical protein